MEFGFESSRFELLKIAGQGGGGQVFQARDRASGELVALKRLPATSGERGRSDFRAEVRLLSRLFHPHLVRIFDYDDSGPCFSMEWVEGRDFKELFPIAGWNELRSYFAQLIQTLAYLHGAKFLHGDLKPANLRVDIEGNLKLLDFGLALPLAGNRPEGAGTAAYLAPEAYGGAYGEASEIFATGVVFYQAATGRLPFSAPLTRHAGRAATAPLLAKLRPDLPEYFCHLIDRMIAISPRRRPSSALAILDYLESHSDHSSSDELSAKIFPTRPPFVGRQEEQERWRELLAKPRSSGMSLVEVVGPTGVGRSRLLEEFQWEAQLEGQACWRLSDEGGRPWSRILAELLDAGENRDLVSLRGRWLSLEPKPILFWRDLHLQSQAELQKLREWLALLRGVPEAGLGVLEHDSQRGPESFVESLAVEGGASLRLALSDLSEADVREIAAVTGRKVDPLLEARGRALLIAQILELGQIEKTPASFQAAIGIQVGRLDPTSLRLLALVAAHDSDIPLAQANALLEGSAWEFEDAALALDRADLLGVSGGAAKSLSLAHPSLRQAYLEALPSSLLAETRRRWARWLDTEAEIATASLRLLVEHALAGGLPEIARRHGLKAIDAESAAGRGAAAIQLGEALLEHADADWEKVNLYARLAYLYYGQGRFDDSLAAYEKWFEHREDDASGLQKVKHRLYTGMALLAAGRSEEAAARLRQCLELADAARYPQHRSYRIRAHLLLASTEDGDRQLREALALTRESPELRAEVEKKLGDFERKSERSEAALRHYRRAAEGSRANGSLQGEAIAEQALAMTLRELGRLGEAQAVLERSIGLAQRHGEVLPWARFRNNLALLQIDRGEYGLAARLFAENRPILEALGNESDRWLLEIHQTLLWIHVGNRGSAERSLQALREKSERLAELGLGAALDELAWLFRRCEQAEEAGIEGLPEPLRSALRRFDTESRSEDGNALLALLRSIQADERPESRLAAYLFVHRILKSRRVHALARRVGRAAQSEWQALHDKLKEDQKLDFEKNRSLHRLNEELEAALPPQAVDPKSLAAPSEGISELRFRQYSAINRQIMQKTSLEDILNRVMDAAIELTGAEKGFLLLQDEGEKAGPFPGFAMKTARGIHRQALEDQEFKISLSAVREAIDTRSPLLTDNAQLDPRLKRKPSVSRYRLTSILVVPMEVENGILGALYLDHRYAANRFSDEDVTLLSAFAAQAALAIERVQMMEKLKRSNLALEDQVSSQSATILSMAKELDEIRRNLRYDYAEIVGVSEPMLRIFECLDRVTDTSIPVWIMGESGTGKELIARSLHFNSSRKEGRFIAENVSAIPEALLESELFGHKRGAFTHADRDRQGLFELADGGTLFLDEIADMSKAMQAKLLRVLQEGEVRPLGTAKSIKVNVRLVTASNRDLERMVKEGQFRQDLFFRINGFSLQLPPLRDRKEDIPLLVERMLKKFAAEFEVESGGVTEECYRLLLQHSWPGNVRELENVVRNAVIFAKGRPIGPKLVSIPQPRLAKPARSSGLLSEKDLILDALRRHGLKKSRVASDLGISLRTLYSRMDRYKIPKKKSVLAKYLGI